ncbi:MAG: hypothetical protein Q9209_003637 [Squamulea sp. 1 TL-2023]
MADIFQNPPVLLNLLHFLNIRSLLNFRLLCKFTHSLISTYKTSIIRSVRETAWHRKSTSKAAYLEISSLQDLIRLNIARELAVKVVASEQLIIPAKLSSWCASSQGTLPQYYQAGIPLDNPIGDEIRDSVTRGFMLLCELRRIQTAQQMDESSDMAKLFSEERRTSLYFQWYRYKDQLLEDPWEKALVTNHSTDFFLMMLCVKGKILYDNCALFTNEPLWINVKTGYENWAMVWLLGHLLEQGLLFMYNLWSEDHEIAVAHSGILRSHAHERSPTTINFESRMACTEAMLHRYDAHRDFHVVQTSTNDDPDILYTAAYCCRNDFSPLDMSYQARITTRSRQLSALDRAYRTGYLASWDIFRPDLRRIGECAKPTLFRQSL